MKINKWLTENILIVLCFFIIALVIGICLPRSEINLNVIAPIFTAAATLLIGYMAYNNSKKLAELQKQMQEDNLKKYRYEAHKEFKISLYEIECSLIKIKNEITSYATIPNDYIGEKLYPEMVKVLNNLNIFNFHINAIHMWFNWQVVEGSVALTGLIGSSELLKKSIIFKNDKKIENIDKTIILDDIQKLLTLIREINVGILEQIANASPGSSSRPLA